MKGIIMEKKNQAGSRITGCAKWLDVENKGQREAQNDSNASSLVTGKMKALDTSL